MAAITINGQKIEISGDKSILEAALGAEIYIPHLCSHPQIASLSELRSIEKVYQGDVAHRGEPGIPFEGCNLCLIEIQGREGLFQSCKTLAEDGLIIKTDSPELKKARQDHLAAILERHPHACLLCPQAEGCDRKICSVHIPEEERCCSQFGNCELQKVTEFIGMEMGLPPYIPSNLPVIENEPLILRDYNLCIGCLRCVKICKDIKGADALGFTVIDGRVFVGSKLPKLKESGCLFCGFCVEVCPTGALSDKDADVGEREAYLIPCKKSCPAEIDVPGYIRFLKEGEFEKALEVVCEKVPLPDVLGRVCFHPCEADCRRGSLDQSVAICALKRSAVNESKGSYPRYANRAKTGTKVAIIGAGPAGLSAAYYLNTLGHSVTVFEALPEVGGMLRVGIPVYRLPREILDREIKNIEDAGVEIKTNNQVDSLEALFNDGFQAVFVAVGAHQGLQLGIPGEENEGVMDGISFLRKVNSVLEISLGETVAIIGGGNVATDSARSAIRKGAKSVTIFYRRTREEMPAYGEEIDAAVEEGINIEYQVAPKKIENVNGSLEVEFIRMKMGAPDASKRPRPIPMDGTEYRLKFDTVITAIGQRSAVPEGFGIPADEGKERKVNPVKGVFLGGDLLTGPRTVIDAIAGGRKGAILIDKYLGGEGDIDEVSMKREPVQLWAGPDAGHIEQGRVLMPVIPTEERTSTFKEVNLGLDHQMAINEARRCLGCDLRFNIQPVVLPPEPWLVLDEKNIMDLPETEGVYVLYDEKKEIYQVSGVENIRLEIMEEYEKGGMARFFSYEEDEMFTSKERQIIQQYMKKHGKMPPGNDEMDDLF